MAQISEAAAKTAAAAAAVQLTLILGDSVDTRCHGFLYHPSHPMRKIEKLFNFNPLTGVVTSDDVYITAAYDNVEEKKKSEFAVLARATAALSTATVEDADPSKMILTYDMVLDTKMVPEAADFVVTEDGAPTAILAITVSGATLNIDMNDDYVNGDVITLDYTPGAKQVRADIAGNPVLALSAQVVTNNVT